MAGEIDAEIVAVFLDEAVDALSAWEKSCMSLETDPSVETCNELFRAAHNLKGASRAVGLSDFGSFVHKVEDVINHLRKEELPIVPPVISVLLEAQVILQEWIDGLRNDPSFIPDTEKCLYKVNLLRMQEGGGVEAMAATPTKPAPSPVDDLDALFAQAQAEAVAAAQSDSKPPATGTPSEEPKLETKPAAKDQKAPGPHKKPEETIRISANRLDELIQLIGELSIHQAIIAEAKRTNSMGSRTCQNALMLTGKISKDLHTKALSLRMQPLNVLFQRLERVARDVARAQDKQINVEIEGSDVDLDKAVIEGITDPMVHILRNAVDHGLETREGRIAAGKPEASTIRLIATQEANGVCIAVGDDGRGLPAEKIRRKAIERGLIPENAQLTPDQINQLILKPGFSTAEKITDISGRGVGLDVVQQAVQTLQGSIDIKSTEGKGTTFSIFLPTSLSIVDALIIRLSELRYAVPMNDLTEIIDLSNYPIETSGPKGKMISLRGDVVPLRDLKEFLNQGNRAQLPAKATKKSEERTKPALIVRQGESRIAFQIDGIIGQQQIVVRGLSDQLGGLKGLSGCTILGDGEPGMIVSLGDLAKAHFSRTQPKEIRV